MRHAKKPLLIAAYHPPWHGLQRSAWAVKKKLDQLDQSVPRRVFIEFESELAHGKNPEELEKLAAWHPFYAAVARAKEYGWTVIPLDRAASAQLTRIETRKLNTYEIIALMAPHNENLLREQSRLARYINKNHREKHWAQKNE